MARKSPKKCRVFLCTRPTESGRAEPLETRYCYFHGPRNRARLEEARSKAHIRNSIVGKKTRATTASTGRLEKTPRTSIGKKAAADRKAAQKAAEASSGRCFTGSASCAFGPSWCPYTRRSHWFWVRTMKAKCETWGKLIAGLASRVPFNPRFPVRF